MSHSKRNTSRAVFTSHERSLAKANWASNSARLNRDSFLPFGSCGLCLEIAREPVSCHLGDIFCRECALANLLTQKKELKRTEKAQLEADKQAAKAKAVEDEEDKQRALRDFELTQAGLTASEKRVVSEDHLPTDTEGTASQAGTKRKFTLDEDELLRIAKDDRAKARRAIENEKAARPTLPSFWTPSLTPDVTDSKLPAVNNKPKISPICPASSQDSPHALSMKKLITIQFQEDMGDSGNAKRWTCPSCLKTLSNSSSPVMAQQCGHVLCLGCIRKFLLPSKKGPDSGQDALIMCYVCDTPVGGKTIKQGPAEVQLPAGLVLLKSEGTGFSARGSNTVEKSGVAFQC